jgi:monoamine oxidase
MAGLAAARAIDGAGRDVVVVEARDRVGGRIWNRTAEGGTVLSVGGSWLGVGQDRMFALCREHDLEVHEQNDVGDRIVRLDGTNHRYTGMIPRVNPVALASLGVALKRLDRMAMQLPLDAPWDARHADRFDRQTLGGWLSDPTHVPTATARTLLDVTMRLLFCVDPAEVSLLSALVLARGGDGFEYYTDTGKTETHLVVGGVPLLADRMAAALGDRVRLEEPVRRIAHDDDGVEVTTASTRVRARHVVVTAPAPLIARIEFEPGLPAGHAHLLRRMVPGSMIRVQAVYDHAFWRDDGLVGEVVAPELPVAVTIDQSDPTGKPGVISGYVFGPAAVELAGRPPAERRRRCLESLVACFGPAAADPVDYLETDWAAEPWSLGAMIAHFPPGTLTSYGPALRAPVGRIHWAGSERATAMHGLMEGAVRSGERAAAEVLAAG